MQRIFVEWGPGPLDRAAQALVAAIQAEPGPWWYVLPGKRAVRQFQAALARHLPVELEPPRGISQGAWLDVLRPPRRQAIDRREAIHVWAWILRAEAKGDFLRLFGQEAPAVDAAGAWYALGQRARDLYAELSQAGLEFGDLARKLPLQAGRWNLWQGLSERYREVLNSQSLCDGMEERGRAPLLDGIRVAWIYTPTATQLERNTLHALGARRLSIVLAPASEAERFDDLGLLLPGAWEETTLPLSLGQWFVERGPKQQADRVVQLLRSMAAEDRGGAPLAASEVQLGTPDAALKPSLARSMRRVALEVRDGAGSELLATPVTLLLRTLARVLPEYRFQEVARLLRHPDLASAFGESEGASLAEILDRYHEWHLPLSLRTPMVVEYGAGRELAKVLGELRSRLGALLEPGMKPLGEWAPAILGFLGWVYGTRRFLGKRQSDREAQATLETLADILRSWQTNPAPWVPRVHAPRALELLVLELQGAALPPLGSGEEPETLEMLGWHELLWDDARAAIITGFNEGAVPEALPDDPLLPPAVRRSLGLPDADSRFVRDLYLLRCLLAVRKPCYLVSGLVTEEGDPLRPSRLAFYVSEAEVPLALQHAFAADSERTPPAPANLAITAPRRLPRLQRTPPLERISVTAFKRYLESPYLFYLERLLHLESTDDLARELDASSFGNLLHAVMEDFGRCADRDTSDADHVRTLLEGFLERRANRLFGNEVLPAVRLQIHGLKRRLAWVAKVQAQRAQKGWRIMQVEWKPADPGLVLEVAGKQTVLIGRIDRIDHHPLHGYEILDFKTSDRLKEPEPDHRSRRAGEQEWTNLQLPLYTFLARELTGREKVASGYFAVGKSERDVWVATVAWTEDDLASAWQKMNEILAAIHRGAFEHSPKGRVYDPRFQAILGQSLAMSSDEETEETGGSEA